jgi:ABC-type multidrug transport system ATPase subunit/ABC-type multidrug transport system permease subunit
MNVLGKVFGLERVFGTRVGNAQLRGVSGGEKKRVSISEVLASRAVVTMWDSATRGLDSSSAVQYVRALRALTNLTKGSTLVTLYQASDSLWDLFDKVLLIDSGKLVYFGPTEDAIRYFEETVGFERQPRQTATDYLNSCTDPVARKAKEGFEGKVPTSPGEMAKRWQESDDKKLADEEMKDYKQHLIDHPRGSALQKSTGHEREKNKRSAGSNYTISLWQQITLLTRRQTQLILRDRPALAAKYGGAVFQALIAGSAFYNQPYTTNSAFTFGGAAFLSILFMSLQGLAELTNQYQLRPILVRHQGFSFYRMSAFALSQVLIDAVSTCVSHEFALALTYRLQPVIAGSSLVFSIILYFLVNLKREPGQFFIFWLFLWLVSMTTYALFRCLAAITPSLNIATRFSGLLIQAIVVYAGYTLAYPNMRYYFRWLPWINPAYYGSVIQVC